MRKTMLLLAAFGLASSLWAAHPFEGTWKLNLAKSKLGPNPPRELTVVTREIGPDLETTFTGTAADGAPYSTKFTMPKQGGVLRAEQAPAQASSQGNLILITIISPSEMYGTSVQDGKQVDVTHSVISKDGKSLNRTSKSLDAEGNLVETLMVFEKQ